MKLFLKGFVKSTPLVYNLYFWLGSLVLKILSLFVRVDERLILFVVYGGQRYDDSPRFVYEYMKSHKEYGEHFKYVWAFISPQDVKEVPDKEKVKIDTWRYCLMVLKAKYWITNTSVLRGLKLKRRCSKDILFQHGMAGIKKLGFDLDTSNRSFHPKKLEEFDYIFVEGRKECDILQYAWNVPIEKFYKTGLPRNDELVQCDQDRIVQLKIKLHIPLDKKIILYAPTFREYNRNSDFAIYLKPPFDFDLWYKELGEEYLLLLTAHYEISRLMNVSDNHPFVVNAFKYPHINDLMLVSDLLISDYSSIIWDYSILGKPIISYAYDFELYSTERGLYEGYDKIFSHGIMKEQGQVIEFIKNMDYEAECLYTQREIRDKYIASYGHATEKSVRIIFS